MSERTTFRSVVPSSPTSSGPLSSSEEALLGRLALELELPVNASSADVSRRLASLAKFESDMRSELGPDFKSKIREMAGQQSRIKAAETELGLLRHQTYMARIDEVVRHGRATAKLTPAKEAQILAAFTGDEGGAGRRSPEDLKRLIDALPVAYNMAFAETPAVQVGGVNPPTPTAAERRRAPSLGVTPDELAAERRKLMRERADGPDEDEDE